MKRPFWRLMGLALLLAAAFQGSRGLYESTEGRYAECARQMLEHGNYAEPSLNGQPHWTKPPVTYWAIAGGMAALGENPWGARAYLVVSFCLTCAVVFALGKQLWDRQTALYCGLVYATAPFAVGAANMVATDMLLALWEAAALLFFWLGVRTRARHWTVLMWSALGVAFMTKGPPALMPLFAIVPVHLHLKRKDETPPALATPLGLLAFAGIGLSWYISEVIRHPKLLEYWLFKETIERSLSAEFKRNPAWYMAFGVYGPVLLFGALPWVGIVAVKWRKVPWPRPTGSWWRPSSWPIGVEWTFLILALVIPAIIFGLSKSKLPLYVLPLFVPLCLGLGCALAWLVTNNFLRQHTVIAVAVVTAACLLGAKFAAAVMPHPNNMAQLAQAVRPALNEIPNHRIFLIDRDPRYGLQFHLRETFSLVAIGEPKPEGALTLAEFPSAIDAELSQGRVVVVLMKPRHLDGIRASYPQIAERLTGRTITLNAELTLVSVSPPAT